jgi:hypothetical protein
MRKIFTIALGTAFFAGHALAAGAPLAPGKPAGVKRAEDISTTVELVGLAAMAVGIALLIGGNVKDNNTSASGTGS